MGKVGGRLVEALFGSVTDGSLDRSIDVAGREWECVGVRIGRRE